jgi:hypothetical protein
MDQDRLINRRQQGDLGEASAIEWLTRRGAVVSLPVGHSPDYDLIAEMEGRLLRVQVKTSTYQSSTPNGHRRWAVAIRTNGGNQSWTGITKRFDSTRVDALFVLVGDGRRWFVPASAVEGTNTLNLGGRKYSEFEIGRAGEILTLVYDRRGTGRTIEPPVGERRSWRAGLGCKPSALAAEWVRIPPPPSSRTDRAGAPRERVLGRAGQAIIRQKRQVTLPARPFTEAGLGIGDRLRFRAGGPGKIMMERIEDPPSTPPPAG